MGYFGGIDPGESGGFGIIDDMGRHVISERWTDTGAFKAAIDRLAIPSSSILLVCLEKVHSMPGQGVSSTFKFGRNFGTWIGIIGTLGIPLEEITPARWMKAVLDSGDRSVSHRMRFASQRWPDAGLKFKPGCKTSVDSGRADGLCLAEYARSRIACVL